MDDEGQVEFEVTPAPDEQAQHDLAVRFTPFPFTADTRDAIFARRSAMSDELVFDLLLEQASIASPHSLYPPDSSESLLDLLGAIAHCPWDALKKSCLHFYLLSHVSSDVAAQHAKECALPPQFIHLAHACFLLDSGSTDDLARAVALLSDARIVQDLSPKILQTLSIAPQPDSSRLVRHYVRTAQPVLEEFEDLAIYVRALISYSLADAWSFQRTFSETTPIRNHLIRTILDTCLIPPKTTALTHLLAIPLTAYEFSLLQSYACSPPDELPPTSHAILQNLITVRLLHSGKYSDAVRISRTFDTLNAKPLSGASAALHKAAEERQQMVRDVLAVIPEVQRRQLELEINDEQGVLSASLSASWVNANADISMSWESLGASMSASAREKAVGPIRSGRLEGSPTPAVLARSNIGTPLESHTPIGTGQKRKAGASTNAQAFGIPVRDTATRTPIFPQIPASVFGTPTATGRSPTLSKFGFSQPPRPAFTPPSLAASPGIYPVRQPGMNPSRNVFYEPEVPRATPPLFAQQQQQMKSNLFSLPAKRSAEGEERKNDVGNKSGEGNPMANGGDSLTDPEDIIMVDSDGPDGFVVRGRRRPPVYPPAPTEDLYDKADSINNGLHRSPPFSPGAPNTQKSDHGEDGPDRVLPGGFSSFEYTEGSSSFSQTGHARAPALEKDLNPPRTHVHDNNDRQPRSPTSSSSPLKIPGGLLEEEDAEAVEEHDHVSSLPSTTANDGRRKRASRRGSVMTDSSEDEQTRTLRRSSRLSSAGPSPEPSSKKAEKTTSTKRTTRSTAGGTARRKQKN